MNKNNNYRFIEDPIEPEIEVAVEFPDEKLRQIAKTAVLINDNLLKDLIE